MTPGSDEGGSDEGAWPADQQRRLALLLQEHGDLAAAIDALQVNAVPDQLQIARLKKRKLRLKDEIAQIQDQMVPDIIA